MHDKGFSVCIESTLNYSNMEMHDKKRKTKKKERRMLIYDTGILSAEVGFLLGLFFYDTRYYQHWPIPYLLEPLTIFHIIVKPSSP